VFLMTWLKQCGNSQAGLVVRRLGERLTGWRLLGKHLV
jgi:hypothetical protein